MIKVMNASDNTLVTMYEGWVTDAYETAIKDIRQNGFDYVNEEINDFGDMVIWVKCR